MKYFLFLLPGLLFFAGCAESGKEANSVPEHQRKEIESAVVNRFNAMIKYSEAGELENVLMHFEPSGPGSYIDRGMRYNTLQDMIDNLRASWKIRNQDYGIPVTKMHVISGEYVLVTSTSTLNTTNRDGVTYQPRPWAVTTLWMQKDGQWFIHSFHQFEGDTKPVEVEQPANK